MTCIAAIVDTEGTGYIASDSLGSNHYTMNSYKNKKIFRKGSFLIGTCGSYRASQILQHQLTLPGRKVGQDLDSYLYVDFVDAVRKSLKDNGEEDGCTFLFVIEGRVFTHHRNFCLLESIDSFEAVGSGDDYARASLHTYLTSEPNPTPRNALTVAIQTAARYVPSVGGDIHHLSSKEEK